jgi:hypothetical protein
MLQNLSCVNIKQRAGCLSYLDDPQGFQSHLMQVLTTEKSNIWLAKLTNIYAFSNNESIINFTKHYLVDPAFEKDPDAKKTSLSICAQCYFINLKRFFGRKNIAKQDDDRKKCVCDKNSIDERGFIQQLAMVTYECVIRDNLVVLPIWITFLKVITLF